MATDVLKDNFPALGKELLVVYNGQVAVKGHYINIEVSKGPSRQEYTVVYPGTEQHIARN